ncbi:hypothetical protein MSIM_13070 [Mycobacterium simiae]|nr:hypothetical protein MSIM_13070 [Mycobacterium simiae]
MAGILFVGGELTQTEELLNTQQKPGAADSADQNGDLHTGRQYRSVTVGRVVVMKVVMNTPTARDNRNAGN